MSNMLISTLFVFQFGLRCVLSMTNLRGNGPDQLMQTAEARWDDLDIVLEQVHGKSEWRHAPDPFAGEDGPRPYLPQKDYAQPAVLKGSTVLVLIAALRERRLVDTLESMFQKASNPKRVLVGVVQQNAPDDADAVEQLCKRLGSPLTLKDGFAGRTGLHQRQRGEDAWGQSRFTEESLAACEPAARIRMFRMSADEAAGPVFARAQQRRLMSVGDDMEDFCMQLDAHTIFTNGWDDSIIQEWAQTKNEYAVLTTYPTNANEITSAERQGKKVPNSNKHWEMPHICDVGGSRGIIRNDQAFAAAGLTRPLLSKFWAAGLSFSRCHAERDVPADPKLKQVFTGEEFSRGARLWTQGYDFYSIARPVIGTYYGSEKGGKGDWHRSPAETRTANQRLAGLLQVAGSEKVDLRGYDLGKRRSLDSYISLTGMDTRSGQYTHTPCGVDRWTPWLASAADEAPPYAPAPDAPMPLEM
jgi:hypothetical protein